MSKKETAYTLVSILAAMGLYVFASFMYPGHAGADIINPHPTPPSDSVTTSMLKNSIVTPAKIYEPGAFYFNSTNATSTTAYTLTVNTSATIASSTFTGNECHNGVCYTPPSAQGSANAVLTNDGSGVESWASPASTKLDKSFTAGEAISKGDAVAFGDGQAGTSTTKTCGTTDLVLSTYYVALATTTPSAIADISSVNFHVVNGGTSGTYDLGVYILNDNGGVPGSTIIGNGTTTQPSLGSGASVTATTYFSTPVAVNPSTTYWFVFHVANTSAAIKDEYGSTCARTISYNTTLGGTYTVTANNSDFGYSYNVNTLADIYQASASNNNYRLNDYIGFAANAAAKGGSVTVDYAGITDSILTTTAGSTYYLGNTAGTISTSAGTNSKKVGLGLGSTGLLIRQDN